MLNKTQAKEHIILIEYAEGITPACIPLKVSVSTARCINYNFIILSPVLVTIDVVWIGE
jgi:hypothetical protein